LLCTAMSQSHEEEEDELQGEVLSLLSPVELDATGNSKNEPAIKWTTRPLWKETDQRSAVLRLCEFASGGECIASWLLPRVILILLQLSPVTIDPGMGPVPLLVVLNVGGSFLEGATKFVEEHEGLAGDLAGSQAAGLGTFEVRFLSSLFRNGMLSVLTSFPDMADAGAVLATLVSSSVFGVFLAASYVAAVMSLGMLAYGQGMAWAARHAGGKLPGVLKNLCAWLPTGCVYLTILTVLAAMFAPELLEGETPDGALGTFDECIIGIAFSCLGAWAGWVVSEQDQLFQSPVIVRLGCNAAATLFVLIARVLAWRSPPVGLYRTLLWKFQSSFCGALSSFSGTIGDVYDAVTHSADNAKKEAEDQGKVSSKLRAVLGLSNFGFHLVITVGLMVMVTVLSLPVVPISTPVKPMHWIYQVHTVKWGHESWEPGDLS